MAQSLAIKYRPKTWNDVVEQSSTKIILSNQIAKGEVKNAYLFVGSAGTGKTTCARIFANEINNGKGTPVELDAASNNSVDDVREIINQAKTKSLNSEYKVFIIDECHSLSSQAWQAMLKIIEEPPAKSIFIFCTTEVQKVPKTIMSRVQRYDFRRISHEGILQRLHYISNEEGLTIEDEAIDYIAKIADGGMRDALTLLDKCIAYSTEVTMENVIKALGTVEYSTMFELTNDIIANDSKKVISHIENIFDSGKDLKQFVKQYIQFLLDVGKYFVGCDWRFIRIPRIEEYESSLRVWEGSIEFIIYDILDMMVNLNSDIKYSSMPKTDIEASLLLMMEKNNG